MRKPNSRLHTLVVGAGVSLLAVAGPAHPGPAPEVGESLQRGIERQPRLVCSSPRETTILGQKSFPFWTREEKSHIEAALRAVLVWLVPMRTPTLARAALLMLIVTPVCSARARESLLAARLSSQAVQNARADAFHLSRLRDLAMVRKFHADGLLVSVPSSTSYYYLDNVPADYRYLRPWSKLFLDQLSHDYYARFGRPLRITSLLRTVQFQRRLARTNPNAADAIGADRSSHLTGATLDISKHFMDGRGQLWMRRYLLRMKREGYLYAVEEFQEPCFHVMVYPTYRQSARRPARPVHRPEHAQAGN